MTPYKPRPPAELLARVEWARNVLGHLPLEADPWTDKVELSSRRSRLGAGYELGNVISAAYDIDSIPSDEVLLGHLRTMSVWLATIYRAEAQTLSMPGEPAPEVADAILAAQLSAGNARGSGQGFKLDVAEKLAIEKHAVAVATAHLVALGYKVTDVGSTQSFDPPVQGVGPLSRRASRTGPSEGRSQGDDLQRITCHPDKG